MSLLVCKWLSNCILLLYLNVAFLCVTLSVQQVSHIIQCKLVLNWFCITMQMFALPFYNWRPNKVLKLSYKSKQKCLQTSKSINITMNYGKCLSSPVLVSEILTLQHTSQEQTSSVVGLVFALIVHFRSQWLFCII